jgi:5-hydroxyisourate hydrolase
MERLSTHVLDTYLGGPAAELEVRLERLEAGREPEVLSRGTTGADGRLVMHAGPQPLPAATYRLVFETGAWSARSGRPCRFPRVVLHFEARPGQRYHLPLYLGPHSFTTYRGS